MIIKSYIPLFIILGLIIGSIIISLASFFTNDSDDAVLLSVVMGLGFLGISFGVFAFYGLVKAIYKKQLRAFISWIILIMVYFLFGFVYKILGTGPDSMSIFYVGLMIMGVNEVWKMWQTRKPKSNNQSP